MSKAKREFFRTERRKAKRIARLRKKAHRIEDRLDRLWLKIECIQEDRPIVKQRTGPTFANAKPFDPAQWPPGFEERLANVSWFDLFHLTPAGQTQP